MRKKGFTLTQHFQYGLPVKLVRDFILYLHIDLESAYPKSSLVVRNSRAALKALDSLKAELDERVCSENPRETDQTVVNIYYGASSWKSKDQAVGIFERVIQALIEEEPPSPSKGKGGREEDT